MSFFGPFGGFGEDPFLSSRNIFQQMDGMMGGMMPVQPMDRMMVAMVQDPFGHDPYYRGHLPALAYPQQVINNPAAAAAAPPPPRDPFQLMPFSPIMGAMGTTGGMGNSGNCHSFSSSTVMTMSTGPDGRPQVYQASSSSRAGPGGVRETRQSVVDGSKGVKKMSIGRHINDRGHIIEKEVGADGPIEERQDFINIDEEEAEAFNNEFKHCSQQAYGSADHRVRQISNRPPDRSSRQTYMAALPAPPSYADDRSGQRRKGGGKSKSHYHH